MSVAQQSGPSFTTEDLLDCLRMVTDRSSYQKATTRRHFKLPQEGQSITWMEVVTIMEGVKNEIYNFDVVMDDLKNLGATITKSSTIAIETKKTSALKQNWLKALPIADHFYQSDNDKETFQKMVNIQLEHLVEKIGRPEVVTLRCPKVQLDELMQDVKRKMKENRSTGAVEFVKHIRKVLNHMDRVDLYVSVYKSRIGGMDQATEEKMMKTISYIPLKQLTIYTNELLFMTYKAERFVDALIECDKIGITRRFDKESMKKIPAIRSVRNNSIVFVEELRFAYDVACQVEGSDKKIDLPFDDNNTFNYIPRNQVDEISKKLGFVKIPFEIVPLDDVRLKRSNNLPILSPKNGTCMEAGTILWTIFDTMAKNLKHYQVDQMTKLVKKVSQYIKPERMAFCMDEEIGARFVEETRSMMVEGADNAFNGKTKSIKALVDREAKKRNYTSFEVILSALLSSYQSAPAKEEVERIIESADQYTLLFEYPELSIAYHNQQLCCNDSKDRFCSITLIEDGEDVGIDVPQRCPGHVNGNVKQIMKMMKDKKITRMNKATDEDDNEEDNEEMEQLREHNAVSKEELAQLKNQCEVLKAAGEKMKKEVGDRRKMEVQLRKETEELREKWNVIQSTITSSTESHDVAMRKLNSRFKKLQKESQVWQMKCHMSNPTDNTSVEEEGTMLHFLKLSLATRNQLEASKAQLQEFLSVSTNTSDKKRAEREFKVFELVADVIVEKAAENVIILTEEPQCPVDELIKIEKLPSVFSKLTMVKMEEAKKKDCEDCFICLDEMCNTSELFNCIVCSAKCHQSCYQTWAANNSSCPLCRQSFPDSNEFPAL